MPFPIDLIGDIHGELPALEALGRGLGYDVAGDWSHPGGRLPVFLGDLVDRGAHSLEIAELVARLVATRRAFCIMGNHEYNLVAWYAQIPGYEKPKPSNAPTAEDVGRRGERWGPAMAFFRELPLAVALPDLRIVHACWHRPSLAAVERLIGQPVRDASRAADAVEWLAAHVVLRSPFNTDGSVKETRVLEGLPGNTAIDTDDIPHENLTKGFELASEPFLDNDGNLRTRIRSTWWKELRSGHVLTDRPQVFGHYWNLPPIDGDMAPPHPSGHPKLRAWALGLVNRVPEMGRLPMTGEVACIDFHGVTKASSRACIGALRWPEREIVWASAEKTAKPGKED